MKGIERNAHRKKAKRDSDVCNGCNTINIVGTGIFSELNPSHVSEFEGLLHVLFAVHASSRSMLIELYCWRIEPPETGNRPLIFFGAAEKTKLKQ